MLKPPVFFRPISTQIKSHGPMKLDTAADKTGHKWENRLCLNQLWKNRSRRGIAVI